LIAPSRSDEGPPRAYREAPRVTAMRRKGFKFREPACRLPRSFALEAVVEAEAQQARLEVVIEARQRVPLSGEIDEKIFDLGRPVLGQRNFSAGADRPAEVRMRFAQARGLELAAAIGEAAGTVDQEVAHRGVAEAAAHRAEPRVRERAAGRAVVGAGDLDIG